MGFCSFLSPPVLLCPCVGGRLFPASLQVDQCLCERPGGLTFFILPRPGACDSIAGSLMVTKSCKPRKCPLTGEQTNRLVQPPVPLLSIEIANNQRAGLRERSERSPEVPGCGALRVDVLDREGSRSETDHWAGVLGQGVPVAEKCSGWWAVPSLSGGAVTHIGTCVKPCRMSTPNVRFMHI